MPSHHNRSQVPNIGNRITLHSSSALDTALVKLGNPMPGDAPDAFTYLHGVCTNSLGDVCESSKPYCTVLCWMFVSISS